MKQNLDDIYLPPGITELNIAMSPSSGGESHPVSITVPPTVVSGQSFNAQYVAYLKYEPDCEYYLTAKMVERDSWVNYGQKGDTCVLVHNRFYDYLVTSWPVGTPISQSREYVAEGLESPTETIDPIARYWKAEKWKDLPPGIYRVLLYCQSHGLDVWEDYDTGIDVEVLPV